MMNMPGRVMEDDTTRTIETKARFDPPCTTHYEYTLRDGRKGERK